ncbi:efflux transporter outer membrane subunit [Parahaliea mediterranea]|uniref:efflux transporter outer membrane subunit n=1 Tax=Parahaliea mediterranea TaxID=651086 RepID=UPI000E2ED988|nr:efflux transporter outer membrane subunit [Parahaliea mediterranea]
MIRNEKVLRHCMLLAALLVTLSGCTVGPTYQAPQPALPAQWQGASGASGAIAQQDNLWWERFNDPVLTRLIEQALAANHDVRIAGLKVQQAQAMRAAVSGALYPGVDALTSTNRDSFSENGPDPIAFLPGVPLDQHGYRMGLNMAWEIDLFGYTRRQVEAADARIGQSAALARGAQLAVVAEVASSYFEWRGLQKRMAIMRQNIALQESTVDLVQRQLNAGLVSDFDLQRAEAQLQGTRAALPTLRSASAAVQNRLAVLIAQMPAQLDRELAASEALPTPPERIPVGLPSEVLRQRPDIMAAERAMASATAQVGVATAALFPRFSLTGSVGVASSHSDNWLDADSSFHGLGARLDWPLFAGGALRANIAAASLRDDEAALRYEQVVLQSLAEVESALVAFREAHQRRQGLARAANTSADVVRLARRQYTAGVADFLAVLDAERELQSAQDQLAQAETANLLEWVLLYRAMGGGWTDSAAVARADQAPVDNLWPAPGN